MRHYRASDRLRGQVAIITGGDSGIGRAVAIGFAKEGADVTIAYLKEHADARVTQEHVEATGRRCLCLSGDVAREAFSALLVRRTLQEFGRIDILVNNAAMHLPQKSITDIPSRQLERTFRVNVFAMFHLVKAALPKLAKDARIINTASVTAYRGSATLVDYAATKGAVVAFTRSLSEQLVSRGIRVNAVAPGPVWTPLIPSSLPARKVATFGSDVPMERAGEPDEIAPSYIFLASADSGYFSGQVLHPNGGEVLNA